MKILATRMLCYLSLAVLLLLGSGVAAWKNLCQERSLTSISYLPQENLIKNSALTRSVAGEIALASPEMDYKETEIAWTNDEVVSVEVPQKNELEWKAVVGVREINTKDVAIVEKIVLSDTIVEKFSTLYIDIKSDEEMVAQVKPVIDEVKTTMAQVEEPTFFEIPKKVETKVGLKSNKSSALDEYSSSDVIEPPKASDESYGKIAATQQEKLDDYPIEESRASVKQISADNAPSYTITGQSLQIAQAEIASPSVNIQKEIYKNPLVNTQKSVKLAYSKNLKSQTPKSLSLVMVKAMSIQNKTTDLKGFELESQDLSNDYWSDNGAGSIKITTPLSGTEGSRSVMLSSRNHVTTHFDLTLQDGQFSLNIPVFSDDKAAEFFSNETTAVPTGSVLVELDEKTEDVGIDGKTAKRINLDSSFRPSKDGDYSYVLFTGVEVGNRTLSSRRTGGEVVHKVLHVHEKEMTFDSNFFINGQKLQVELNERGLLSKDTNSLIVNEKQVQHYFSQTDSQKLGFNQYVWKKMERPLGMRHYLALNHQSDTLFVGTWSDKKIEIPTEDYTREVIRKFKLSANSRSCLIQVNLSKLAKSYSVLSESYGEAQITSSQVMDKDGKFYDSLSENSRKLFVMGENQGGDKLGDNGKMNFKIEYLDGTFDYFSSFCSPQTYLVEQL